MERSTRIEVIRKRFAFFLIAFLFRFVDPFSDEEIHGNRKKHQKYILRFAPRIKKQAEEQQNDIPKLSRCYIVEDQYCRQKPEQKQQTAENHN